MFATTTGEDVLLCMKALEEVRMRRKQIEKEEEQYVDQLAAAIRRLP
jgi:aminoglycoside phosphotransferase